MRSSATVSMVVCFDVSPRLPALRDARSPISALMGIGVILLENFVL